MFGISHTVSYINGVAKDLGVSVEQTYVIKKVDYDFFNDYM